VIGVMPEVVTIAGLKEVAKDGGIATVVDSAIDREVTAAVVVGNRFEVAVGVGDAPGQFCAKYRAHSLRSAASHSSLI